MILSQYAATLCFDFEKDSIGDLHSDYIFMVQILLHIKDYKSVLEKLYDVFNPGGHLIIIDFNKNHEIVSDMVHNGFNQKELTTILSEIGYKIYGPEHSIKEVKYLWAMMQPYSYWIHRNNRLGG